MAYKEKQRIKKENLPVKTKTRKSNEMIPIEKGFVCGIDTDLKSKISEKNRTILIRGWCYHKNAKIKQLFIGFNEKEEKISNFGFPRTDILSEHKHPNSANSGFWKIITIPKMNNFIDIFLRANLDNHEQVKHKIATLEVNHRNLNERI